MPKSPKRVYSAPKVKEIEPEDTLDASLKMAAGALMLIANSVSDWVKLQREIFLSETEEVEEPQPATVGTAEYESDNGDDEEEEEPESEEPAARFVPHQTNVSGKSS
jgi:hypothetical protein